MIIPRNATELVRVPTVYIEKEGETNGLRLAIKGLPLSERRGKPVTNPNEDYITAVSTLIRRLI